MKVIHSMAHLVEEQLPGAHQTLGGAAYRRFQPPGTRCSPQPGPGYYHRLWGDSTSAGTWRRSHRDSRQHGRDRDRDEVCG